MATPLRSRKAVLEFKLETTAGVDAVPGSSDAIYVEVTGSPVQPAADRIQTNYVSGSLDRSGSLIGGMRANMTVMVPISSAVAPGMLPDWDPLMSVCGFAATQTKTDITATTISFAASGGHILDSGSGLANLTANTVIYVSGAATTANNGEFVVATSAAGDITVTKIDGTAAGLVDESAGATVTLRRGVAGVAATTGSATTLTLASPFAASSQTYRHMPLWLQGNPATSAYAFVSDYTSGRVATLTDTFSPILSSSTHASTPANTLYLPTSVSANLKTASAYLYVDGVCYQVVGLTGTWRVTNTTAGIGRMEFQLQGIFQAKVDGALPAYTPPSVVTPIMRGGAVLMNRSAVSCRTLSIQAGNQIVLPPNPNATQGFDPGVILSRKFEGSIDPMDTLVATRDIMTDFKNGTERVLHARYGSVAGARVAFTVPTAKYIQHSPNDDGGIQRTGTGFECNGNDGAAIGMCIW